MNYILTVIRLTTQYAFFKEFNTPSNNAIILTFLLVF